MQIKYVFHTLLAGLLILSACQIQTPSTSGIKANTASLSQPNQRAFNQRKGPYTGPVSIKVNTGLMQQGTGKVVEIKSQDNFKIQAVPQGPVVFSETLQVNRPNQDFTRLFKVPNTGKRYIVHVAKQEPQRGRDSRVQVNLNGAWVIREKDFERGEEEFQTTGLLLNANNSLKIRFKGKTGSRLTLTVVDAGEAGTILRRRGWEKDKDLTQADRVRNNDTNIFDPNQPDSLGGLQPYEGDEAIFPDQPNSPRLGISAANGSEAKILVGQFYLTLAEPYQANLDYMLANYPVELAESYNMGDYTQAIFKVQLDQVNLQNLPDNIAALNLREDFPIMQDIVFSSVGTAKTASVILDILANETERTVYLGFENHMEKHFQNSNGKLTTEEESRSDSYTPGGFTQPVKSSDLWWLEKTNATKAWNYGMGHGVTVALLDDGFGFINTKNTAFMNKTFYDKKYTRFPQNRTNPAYDDQEETSPSSGILKTINSHGHGLWVANIIAARSDDKEGIAGIAPKANIFPMVTELQRESNTLLQLNRIATQTCLSCDHDNNPATPGINIPAPELAKIEVINISHGRLLNIWDFIINPKSGDQNISIIRQFVDVLKKLDQKKIVVVASAGNYNKENKAREANIPGSLAYISEQTNPSDPNSFVSTPIISVGAYDKNNQRAYFHNPTNSNDFIASNYGIVDLWAPGKDLWSQNKVLIGNNYVDRFENVSGTSFAAPQVAGAVALLKGWNKNLNTAQIKDILQSTAMAIQEPAGIPKDRSFMPSTIQSQITVKGLDVLAAIKHPSINAKPYQSYTGTAQANGTVLINGTTYTTKPNYLDLDPTIQVGSSVSLSGWLRADNPNIPTNEIHLIGLETNPLQLVQFLPTVGALDPIPFTIANQHYLAIPNYFSGSTYHISSHIYRWNGSQFILHQTIPTFGAYDLLPFKIGNQTFLAVANYDETRFMAGSEIYRWDGTQFVPFQSFADTGGVDWEYFEIDGGHYLALANFFNGSFSRQSQIFKWNGVNFAPFQTLQTNGAHKWTHFMTTGTEKYLALTTYLSANQNDPVSELYKWNGSQFVFNQTFATDNDMDFEPFTINGQLYTAIINNGRINDAIESKILKWENNRFVDFQNVSTTGARNWSYFSANNGHYLVLTSNAKGPQIYRWNGNTFELYHEVSMVGAWGSALFSPNPTEYFLILSSLRGALGYADPSRVYKFNP